MVDHKPAIEGLQSYLDAIDVNGTAIWDDYRPKLQAAIAALEALAADNARLREVVSGANAALVAMDSAIDDPYEADLQLGAIEILLSAALNETAPPEDEAAPDGGG